MGRRILLKSETGLRPISLKQEKKKKKKRTYKARLYGVTTWKTTIENYYLFTSAL
jgi:hypothetical protein